ncbi:MAG: ribonuclease III [Bacteroidales bacterium]|nr:ribonuclease III [Bacteroidales bacterium]
MFLFKRLRIHFSSDKKLFKIVKNIFGFYPGNIFLYKLALRHRSVSQTFSNGFRISNERLEFLGDAILDAVVADYMFKKYPLRDEGFLTEMRSKVVSRQQLNKLSQKLGLQEYIITSPETGSFHKSVNGDAFEAFIGAMYLDKGYSFSKKIIITRLLEVHYDMDSLVETNFNYKSRLIEWGQKEKKIIQYNLLGETGVGHNKQYIIEVCLDGEALAQAQDFSIKGAEQLASEKAFANLPIA